MLNTNTVEMIKFAILFTSTFYRNQKGTVKVAVIT